MVDTNTTDLFEYEASDNASTTNHTGSALGPTTTSTKSTLDLAREYKTKYGMSVIPVPRQSKNPDLGGWQNLRITEEELPKYFDGSPQNISWLPGEPSNGLVDIDIDSYEALMIAEICCPKTHLIYGRKGKPRSHRIVRSVPLPDSIIGKSVLKLEDPSIKGKVDEHGRSACIVELRTTRCHTVLPGSTHEDTGENIEWDEEGTPTSYAPDYLIHSLKIWAAAALLGRHMPGKGSRQDATLAICGGLFRLWQDKDKVKEFLSLVLKVSGDEEYDARMQCVNTTERQIFEGRNYTGWKTLTEYIDKRVVQRVCNWIGDSIEMEETNRNMNRDADPAEDTKCSDIGNAARFADMWCNELKWVPAWKCWMFYNGIRWEHVDEAFVIGKSRDVVYSLFDDARDLNMQKQGSGGLLWKWADKSCAAERLSAMVRIAKADMSISSEVFDDAERTRYRLNVRNGTINLKTGKLEPHNPLDYTTLVAPVTYDEDAPYPLRWTNHLKWCFKYDRNDKSTWDVYWYIHKILALSITGDVSHRVIPVQHGDGSNGKSVIIGVMSRELGPYAHKMKKETLLQKQYADGGGDASPDIIKLKGKRFVYASETNEGETMDVSKVKDWASGSEKLSGRALYQDSEEFWPQFILWITSNHKLRIPETKPAIWNRLRLIHYSNTIETDRMNTKLAEEIFNEESSGILNWLIEGVRWLLEEGIKEPSSVIESTLEYRDEQDVFKRSYLYIFDISDKSAHTPLKDLYRHYETHWSGVSRGKVMLKKDFTAKLVEMGFVRDKLKGTSLDGHRGIKIKLPEEEKPETLYDKEASPRLVSLLRRLYHNAVSTDDELRVVDLEYKEDIATLNVTGWTIIRTGRGYVLDTDKLPDMSEEDRKHITG